MILVVAGVQVSGFCSLGSYDHRIERKAWFGSSAYAVVPLQMTVVVRSATTSALLLKFFLAYSTSFHYIFIIEIKVFPVLILYDRTLFTFTCNPQNKNTFCAKAKGIKQLN